MPPRKKATAASGADGATEPAAPAKAAPAVAAASPPKPPPASGASAAASAPNGAKKAAAVVPKQAEAKASAKASEKASAKANSVAKATAPAATGKAGPAATGKAGPVAAPSGAAVPKAEGKAKPKAKPKATAAAAVAEPKAKAEAQPAKSAEPKASSKAKASAKAAGKPSAAPLQQQQQQQQAADADGGEFGEVASRRKKKKNQKKAEGFAEDSGPAPQEDTFTEDVLAEMARIKSLHESNFTTQLNKRKKDLETVPEVSQVPKMAEVSAQRQAIEEVIKDIDEALKKEKVPRPKNINTMVILQQMKETHQVQSEPEDLREEMLQNFETEMKTVIAWESFKEFQVKMTELRGHCERKLKKNDDMNAMVRTANVQRRIVERVAQLKGVKVEDLDEKRVVSKQVDLPVEVTSHPWVWKRFEKLFGTIVDRPDGKGSGKGTTTTRPPTALIVKGLDTEVASCVEALKGLDLSDFRAITVNSRQASAIMGAGQSNAREIEAMFKGVYLHSDSNRITVYGPKGMVVQCMKHLENVAHKDVETQQQRQQQQQSAPKELTIDKDRTRALIGLSGAKVKEFEAETGTTIKVDRDGQGKSKGDENAKSTVRIMGDSDKTERARIKIENYLKSLEEHVVEADPDVIWRLYDGGQRKGGGRGGRGKGRSPDAALAAAAKFSELRATAGLTVSRKDRSIHLLGMPDVVAKAKETLEECVKEAGSLPTFKPVTYDQARLWTEERCKSVSSSTGCEVKLRKPAYSGSSGKGGEAVGLELTGTEKQKEDAHVEIDAVHERHTNVQKIENVREVLLRSLRSEDRTKEIEREHDVHVKIDLQSLAIKITGEQESCESAREALQRLLDEAPADLQTREMEIDPSVAALVIGKQGATVREIKEKSGLRDLQVEGKRKVVILTGEPEALDQAERLVQKAIDRPKDGSQAAWTSGQTGASSSAAPRPQQAHAETIREASGGSGGGSRPSQNTNGAAEAAPQAQTSASSASRSQPQAAAAAPKKGARPAPARANVDLDNKDSFPTLGGSARRKARPDDVAWGKGAAAAKAEPANSETAHED